MTSLHVGTNHSVRRTRAVPEVMPPAFLTLKNRLAAAATDPGHAGRIALLAVIHATALGLLIAFESEPAAQAAFALTWGFLNCFWIAVLGRPVTSGALSLAMVVLLTVLSYFKHSVLMMTATFVDVMVIDFDTFTFLLRIIPGLAWKVALVALVSVTGLILLWRLEPFRVRRSLALAGGGVCLAALAALSLALPSDREAEFWPHQYVSKFARSAAVSIVDLMVHGMFEADAAIPERLDLAEAEPCPPKGKLPHIVMVFDESSFDATMLPGVKVPPNYQERFRSSDGKQRSFVVEGAGGPSWFTEYNVLSGLSVRSYGRFAEFGDAPRRRPGQARPAVRAAPVRLQDLHPLFLVRRVCRRARLPDLDRHRALSRLPAVEERRGRHRHVLLRPCRTPDRTRARRRPAVPVRLSGDEPLSLGLPLPARPVAGLEAGQ